MESKLAIRLVSVGAFFSVYRHSVASLLAFYYEKNFRNLGSRLNAKEKI